MSAVEKLMLCIFLMSSFAVWHSPVLWFAAVMGTIMIFSMATFVLYGSVTFKWTGKGNG